MRILQQIDGAPMLPLLHATRKSKSATAAHNVSCCVNLQTRHEAVRYSQAVTSRRNALAVLQVNDYPMPMTPTAATATEMLPMPPLEQTGEVASKEASPAHLTLVPGMPFDSKSAHRDGDHRHGLLDFTVSLK